MSFIVIHSDFSIKKITPLIVHVCLSVTALLWSIDRFNGVVRLREKAPDAITSYMISAFAIDDLYGLGVTDQPTKVSL